MKIWVHLITLQVPPDDPVLSGSLGSWWAEISAARASSTQRLLLQKGEKATLFYPFFSNGYEGNLQNHHRWGSEVPAPDQRAGNGGCPGLTEGGAWSLWVAGHCLPASGYPVRQLAAELCHRPG